MSTGPAPPQAEAWCNDTERTLSPVIGRISLEAAFPFVLTLGCVDMDKLPRVRSAADLRALKLALIRVRGEVLDARNRLDEAAELLQRARAVVVDVERELAARKEVCDVAS